MFFVQNTNEQVLTLREQSSYIHLRNILFNTFDIEDNCWLLQYNMSVYCRCELTWLRVVSRMYYSVHVLRSTWVQRKLSFFHSIIIITAAVILTHNLWCLLHNQNRLFSSHNSFRSVHILHDIIFAIWLHTLAINTLVGTVYFFNIEMIEWFF